MMHDTCSIAKLRESLSYIKLFFAGKEKKSEQYNRAELELNKGQYNAAAKRLSDLNDYIQFASKKAQALSSDIPRIKDIIKMLSNYTDSIDCKIKQIEIENVNLFENRIKAVQRSLDAVVSPKTLTAVNENDVILKRLKSDLLKIQSDLDSARFAVESKKSLQEKIDSLNDGIGKRQEINDQYRKTLIVEHFEEKIAEIKRLLDSVDLDTEQNVTDVLSILDRVGLLLEEIDPQIREVAIDQADKDRLLQETARLKLLSEKWRNLAARLSKAYNLLNNIRLQLGLGQEGKGGIFKKIKAAVFKYEYSINLIYATVAAIVGTFEIKPEYARGYIKKYLEYDKSVFDYIKTHKKEYYDYVVKKTSIDGWLPKDSSEYDYYEPVLKELIDLDSEVEYTGARAVLPFAIPLFVISLSPFVIIPWMYMDRIEQIMAWFL